MSVVWGSKVQPIISFFRLGIILLCSFFLLLPEAGSAGGSGLPTPDWVSPGSVISDDATSLTIILQTPKGLSKVKSDLAVIQINSVLQKFTFDDTIVAGSWYCS